eukprot:13031611-Heterocapsa_arctica.AAC.1
MLKDAKAQQEVIRCAAAYRCDVCMGRVKPASWAKVGIPIFRTFNGNVYIDVMSVQTGAARNLVL